MSLRLRELIESRVINIVDRILGSVEVYGVGREWNEVVDVYIVGLMSRMGNTYAAIDLHAAATMQNHSHGLAQPGLESNGDLELPSHCQ